MPEEAAPHADALAVGEGVQLWGQILQDVAEADWPKFITVIIAGRTAKIRPPAGTSCHAGVPNDDQSHRHPRLP